MEDKTKSGLVDNIANTLRKAAIEIEELELQAALGKAEALDKYEEVKKKFNKYIHETKAGAQAGKDKFDDLHAKFDELRVQLALGRAETVDLFREQKKNLLLKIHDIEHSIKNNDKLNEMYAFLLLEFEKFKAQLEVLEEKFDRGGEKMKANFEDRKKTFDKFINDFSSRFNKKEESRWEHFQGEISEAFNHFKQAFNKA